MIEKIINHVTQPNQTDGENVRLKLSLYPRPSENCWLVHYDHIFSSGSLSLCQSQQKATISYDGEFQYQNSYVKICENHSDFGVVYKKSFEHTFKFSAVENENYINFKLIKKLKNEFEKCKDESIMVFNKVTLETECLSVPFLEGYLNCCMSSDGYKILVFSGNKYCIIDNPLC